MFQGHCCYDMNPAQPYLYTNTVGSEVVLHISSNAVVSSTATTVSRESKAGMKVGRTKMHQSKPQREFCGSLACGCLDAISSNPLDTKHGPCRICKMRHRNWGPQHDPRSQEQLAPSCKKGKKLLHKSRRHNKHEGGGVDPVHRAHASCRGMKAHCVAVVGNQGF